MNSASNRLIDLNGVKAKVGLSKPTIYQKIRDEDFPPPVKLGAGMRARSAWVESEVDQWIASRMAARKRRAS